MKFLHVKISYFYPSVHTIFLSGEELLYACGAHVYGIKDLSKCIQWLSKCFKNSTFDHICNCLAGNIKQTFNI